MTPSAEPAEHTVLDELIRCPYLPEQTARLPLRLPARRLRPEEFAARLNGGDRRQGRLLYRPSCPSCRACEAIRIDVSGFHPNATQRRVWRRGNAALETGIERPTCTAEKIGLF